MQGSDDDGARHAATALESYNEWRLVHESQEPEHPYVFTNSDGQKAPAGSPTERNKLLVFTVL